MAQEQLWVAMMEDRRLYSNLVSEIDAEVRRRWKETNSLTVLAKVGLSLSQEARSELESAGVKLKSFILMHMNDQIIVFYDHRITDCLAPLPEAEGFPEDELVRRFLEVQASSNIPTTRKRKIRSEIWSAFTTPLDARRFLSFSDNGNIHTIDGDDPLPGSIEIKLDDVSFDEKGNKLSLPELFDKIESWSVRHKVPSEHIYDPISAVVSRKMTERVSEKTLMALLIESLTQDQLRRINLAGDIVQRLIEVKLP